MLVAGRFPSSVGLSLFRKNRRRKVMYKKVNSIGIAIIVMVFCGIVNAEQVPNTQDGFYIGGQISYTDGKAEHSFSNPAPPGDSKPSGFGEGIFVGYHKHFSKFKVGIEPEFNKSHADGDFVVTSGLTSSGSIDFNYTYAIRAKVGYPISNLNIIPYLTGGIAYSDVDIQGGPSNDPKAGQYSSTYNGWVAGFGIERSVINNFTARLEYQYTDYGSEAGSLSPGFPGVQMPVDLRTHSLQLGLYYRF